MISPCRFQDLPYLAESVKHMEQIRINQSLQVERQNRGERYRFGVTGVKDARSIYLVADEVKSVPITKPGNVPQGVNRVTPT